MLKILWAFGWTFHTHATYLIQYNRPFYRLRRKPVVFFAVVSANCRWRCWQLESDVYHATLCSMQVSIRWKI